MKKHYPLLLITLGTLTGCIVLIFYSVAYFNFEHNFFKWYVNYDASQKVSPHEALGSTGDFLGGVLNPILTFFSFSSVLYSIHLQKKIDKEDKKHKENDKFEATFFELINQLSNFQPNNEFIQEKLRESFRNSHITRVRANIHKNNDVYGHYYRLIFQILKFIAHRAPGSTYANGSACSDSEKFYAGILRSLISHSQTQVLAINSCCLQKNDSFQHYMKLIKRYALLEHMPLEIKCDDPTIRDNSKVYFSSLFYIYRSDAFNKSDFLREHLRKNLTHLKRGKTSAYYAIRYANESQKSGAPNN